MCRNTQACDQLPLPPNNFVTLEKILSLSSIQHHQMAASLAGPCWLHSQERMLGPKTALGDTGQPFNNSCFSSLVFHRPTLMHIYPGDHRAFARAVLLSAFQATGHVYPYTVECSGTEMKPL